MMGRTVNVTRKVTMASVHAPRSFPRNSMCHNSRQLGIALKLPRGKRATYTTAELTATTAFLCLASAAPARTSARAVHAKLLELAGECVASPTEQLGRFL